MEKLELYVNKLLDNKVSKLDTIRIVIDYDPSGDNYETNLLNQDDQKIEEAKTIKQSYFETKLMVKNIVLKLHNKFSEENIIVEDKIKESF